MESKSMMISVALCTFVGVVFGAGGDEYLPPNKGYNYPPPDKPFTTGNTGLNPTRVPYPSRPTQGPYRPATGPGPAHQEDHHHHEPGMPFDFNYAVNEPDYGNDYSHNAISDGDVTRGEYRVALPDGRLQIVRYTADWKNGFNAEVSYEGEARYPDQQQGQQSQNYGQQGGYKY